MVLYELLTGKTPIDQEALRNAGFDEVRRHICEGESPTPSTQLATLNQSERTTIAANRSADPKFLDSMLRRELDWVVMKSLEKDRTRRYQAVSELGDDIRRYLAGEPVAAVPPSAMYKLQKLAGRHRGLLMAAATLAVVLIAATIVSTWQATRATKALQISSQARAELALDKGQMLGDQGDANRALLWMARSLELVPDNAPHLESVIRTNLGSWQHRVNRVVQKLAPAGRVDAVAFPSDTNTLLTVSRQEKDGVVIQWWNRETGEGTRTIEHRKGRVLALSLRDDARELALGYGDGRVELFDLDTREVKSLEKQPGFITKLLFSPDGKQLLVACGRRALTEQEAANENRNFPRNEGLVQLFDLQTHQPQFAEPLQLRSLVWAADFADDGTWFAVHSGPWVIPLKGLINFFKVNGEEHRAPLQIPVSALSIAISSDSKYLLTGDSLRRARRWNLETDEIVNEFLSNAPVSVVGFHPRDDKIVLSASYDGSVRLWNVDNDQPVGTPLWHRALVRCAGFSADGKTLLSGASHSASVVGLPNASPTKSRPKYAPEFPIAFDGHREAVLVREQDFLQLKKALTGEPIGKSIPWKGRVIHAACNVKHSRVVSLGFNGVATLWNVETGEQIAKLRRRNKHALSAAISDQGIVAVGFFDGVAELFDANTGKSLEREFAHQSHSGPIFSIQLRDDLLLTGGADGFARLWNAMTGKEIESFHHPTYCIAAFSPDGSRIVTSGSGQTTRIWSATGKLISTPLRHPAQVLSSMFSLNGRTLVTGCTDGKARLWDVATARQLMPAITHTDEVGADLLVLVGMWPEQQTLFTLTGANNIGLASKATPAIYRQFPTPMKGTPNDITLWAQTITGMALDEKGAVDALTVDAWRKRRDELTQRGIPTHSHADQR